MTDQEADPLLATQIAIRIIARRKARSLSQQQLANLLGVSQRVVSKWESAKVCPSATSIVRLCKVFGISADALLGLES